MELNSIDWLRNQQTYAEQLWKIWDGEYPTCEYADITLSTTEEDRGNNILSIDAQPQKVKEVIIINEDQVTWGQVDSSKEDLTSTTILKPGEAKESPETLFTHIYEQLQPAIMWKSLLEHWWLQMWDEFEQGEVSHIKTYESQAVWKKECLRKNKHSWRPHSDSGSWLNMRNSVMNSWPRRKSSSANGKGSGVSSWNGKWSSRMNSYPTAKGLKPPYWKMRLNIGVGLPEETHPEWLHWWGVQRELWQTHKGGEHHSGWGPISCGTMLCTSLLATWGTTVPVSMPVHQPPMKAIHIKIMRENAERAPTSNSGSNVEVQKSTTGTQEPIKPSGLVPSSPPFPPEDGSIKDPDFDDFAGGFKQDSANHTSDSDHLHSDLQNISHSLQKGSISPNLIWRTWPPLPRSRGIEEVLAPSPKMRFPFLCWSWHWQWWWYPGKGGYSQYWCWTRADLWFSPASVEPGLLMHLEGQGCSPCHWLKGPLEPKERLHQYTGQAYHQSWDCRHH